MISNLSFIRVTTFSPRVVVICCVTIVDVWQSTRGRVGTYTEASRVWVQYMNGMNGPEVRLLCPWAALAGTGQTGREVRQYPPLEASNLAPRRPSSTPVALPDRRTMCRHELPSSSSSTSSKGHPADDAYNLYCNERLFLCFPGNNHVDDKLLGPE